MLKTEATERITLLLISTSSMVAHGVRPLEFLGVSTTANPACAALQLYSITFPRTMTLRAFLSSNRFLTVHDVPRHCGFLVSRLPSTRMSLGTTLGMLMWAPP